MSGFYYLACLHDLFMSCLYHPMVLVKTIRFPVRWTEEFLRNRPNFKLLVLFRDPRATLHSQSAVFKHYNWVKDIAGVSQLHCRRLQEDIEESERLKKLYPDRLKCIRYEDIATDPPKYFGDVYEFLGLDFNEGVIDYIRHLTTRGDHQSENSYSIERNPTLAMSGWRAVADFEDVRADFEDVRIVDEMCGHLYSILGYRLVDSQQDLVSNRPLATAPQKTGIF
ncbi:hypothetical protein Btru_058061 [Bulinus truncatus]|nr:hypothetical protein Btru_058061 [Bulinus truncatus]